jgi:hypothetical protein
VPVLADPEPDDIPEVVLDPHETHRSLGWTAVVSLTSSLETCLQSYDAVGLGPVHTHLRPSRETHG